MYVCYISIVVMVYILRWGLGVGVYFGRVRVMNELILRLFNGVYFIFFEGSIVFEFEILCVRE